MRTDIPENVAVPFTLLVLRVVVPMIVAAGVSEAVMLYGPTSTGFPNSSVICTAGAGMNSWPA